MSSNVFEIIHVLDDGRLATPSHPASHLARDGRPLVPGYYLALWRPGRGKPALLTPPRLFGPVSSRAVADRLRVSAAYLGLIDGDLPTQQLPADPGEGSAVRRSGAPSPAASAAAGTAPWRMRRFGEPARLVGSGRVESRSAGGAAAASLPTHHGGRDFLRTK